MCPENRELLLANGAEINLRLQFIQLDGEIDPVHLVGNDALKVHFPPLGPDNRDLVARDESRLKERKSLDVVPVGMSDQQVRIRAIPRWR